MVASSSVKLILYSLHGRLLAKQTVRQVGSWSLQTHLSLHKHPNSLKPFHFFAIFHRGRSMDAFSFELKA